MSLSCSPGRDRSAIIRTTLSSDRGEAESRDLLFHLTAAVIGSFLPAHYRHTILPVRETVSHAVRGIAAGVDGKSTLQFVMSSFVQQIADRNYPSHSASEENQLASGSTLAKRLGHRIYFPSSIAQVVMRNTKVNCLQCGVTGKKNFVRSVPKTVCNWNLGQTLSRGSSRSQDRHNN